MGGDSQYPEFAYGESCVYSYMFELQSPSKHLHWMPCTSRDFFPLLRTVLNSSLLMPFSASVVFCFTSSTWAKCFPSRTFFPSREKRNTAWSEIRWIGRVGHGALALFSQKLLHTQCSAGRCTCGPPIRKWADALRESSKKFTEAQLSLSKQRQRVH